MNDWQRFFDGYAPKYLGHEFTHNTLAEVDFLLDLLQPPAGGRFLDMGCGTGRHSVELARRGYRVTGVDLSTGMLAEAAKAANEAGVSVEWVQSDATQYTANAEFDITICLCEGAFGLLSLSDDPLQHDLAILGNVYAALKPGGSFLLTALNGLRMARCHTQEDVADGRFDPMTMTETNLMEWDTPEGPQSAILHERGFTPTELALLFRTAGFTVQDIWGGTAGNWGKRPLDLDEYEIMVVGRKSPLTEK